MLIRILNQFSGAADTLCFSNCFELLSQRIFFRRNPITVYEWKKRFHLVCDRRHLDAGSPKEVLARGVYNQAILKSFGFHGFHYVNVGGNVGAFDIAVSALIRSVSSGLLFELNPETSARLHFNLAINGLRHLDVFTHGVGGEARVIDIPETGCAHSFGLYNASGFPGRRTLRCRVETMETSLALHPSPPEEWDLLKLDCEGAEFEIIRLSSRHTLRRFRNIVMELHPPPQGEDASSLLAKLAESGFVETPIVSNRNGIRFFQRTE